MIPRALVQRLNPLWLGMSCPFTNNVSSRLSLVKKLLSSVAIRNCHTHHSYSHGQLQHQRMLRLLQKCSKPHSLDAAKSLHALTITIGSNWPQSVFLNNNIISMYVSLGCFFVARKVFDEMPRRNVVSYNTMVGAYCRNGNAEESWGLFIEMRNCGFEPSQFTFGSLLSCDSLGVGRGILLHVLIVKSGLLYADAFAGTALLGLFGRHGWLDEANRVFEDMPLKSLVTWNSMMSLFGNHGFANECMLMFSELMRTQMSLSEYSFVGILTGFSSERDLESGEQIHGLVIKNGFEDVVSVANSLVKMYAKCSCTAMAEKMFEEVPNRDIVSWNTVMGVLSKGDRPDKALELLSKMSVDGILPNETTCASAITSCIRCHDPIYGELIHAKIIKIAFESDVHVGSALVNFYAKCDRLDDAHHCFNEILEKNLICWNALMLSYSNRGCSTSVVVLQELIRSGHCPNEFTFSIVFKSSGTFELQQIHSMVIKTGYHLNDYVSSSLITSYAKNDLVSDALTFVADTEMPLTAVPTNVIAGLYNRSGQYEKTQELFCDLEDPDIVSWNILIAACSRNGDYKEVFELFQHMQVARIHPDNYTYVSLLSVCTKLCNLPLGSSLHGLIIKTNFKYCDIMVGNIMIDMYGKCGSLESSIKIFDEMTNRNIISWTALVSVLGLHGHAQEALGKFREMEMTGNEPDGVAYISVLSACRHAGLVKEGMELFEQMKWKYGIEPQMDHYLVVVDLLARHGFLKEAEQLISRMPFPPNALIWRSFLEGCKRRRRVEDLVILKPGIDCCYHQFVQDNLSPPLR